jgi:hypothetical protein
MERSISLSPAPIESASILQGRANDLKMTVLHTHVVHDRRITSSSDGPLGLVLLTNILQMDSMKRIGICPVLDFRTIIDRSFSGSTPTTGRSEKKSCESCVNKLVWSLLLFDECLTPAHLSVTVKEAMSRH